jgi:formylglycine-generating enzyme required for sulfatase activity
MEDQKDLISELAKRLTPGLAFAALMFWLVAMYGERIPSQYQAIPYILIIGGFLVYTLITIVQVRQKSQPAHQGNVDITEKVEGSVIVTSPDNQITQIVNHYTKVHPETNKSELLSQITGYLAWVEETFGKITLRGIEQSGRQVVELPLDTIYVPLQAEYTSEKNADLLKQHTRTDETGERSQKVALNQILSLGTRLIITGGPGSGKTTVLQHIAWTLAYAIRSEQAETARQKLGLTPPLPLPIYVPLSLYASYHRKLPPDAPGEKKTLAAFIADYLLQNQTNLELNRAFFADLLRNEQRVLLLLDGLDEVPEEAERIIVRRDIEHLVSGKENLRVVVTSRSAAYQGRAVLGRGFQHVRVLSISDGQIKAIIQQAYQAIYPQTPHQARARADELLNGIQRLETERRQRLGEDILALVSTPLMVRMLLIVHFNNRRLPDQRADLYQKAVDAMLRPDYTLDETVSQEIEQRVGGSLAINREMLQLVAFHMHQRGAEQGREISEDALCQILESNPTYTPFVSDLVSQTRQRGTLLEERGGLYRFIHLSFQEYLTGRYLVERMRDIEKIAEFLENGLVNDAWWREPILLMIGYLDITSPQLAHEMLSRLAGLDEEAEEKIGQLPLEMQLAAVELSAAAYQECQNQSPVLKASLLKRLRFFFKRENQENAAFAPAILASAADSLDRFGYLPDDLHTFVEIPQTQFRIGKYLVTNAQYERFLQADDFASEAYWTNFPKFSEPDEETGEITEIGDWGDEGWQWLQKTLKDQDQSPDGKVVLPRYWHDPRFGMVRAGVPVVGISWHEANAYCRWLLAHWDKLTEAQQNPGWKPGVLRLPTEAEWIAAAGGAEPNGRYPWDKEGEITQDIAEIMRRGNVNESNIGRSTPVSTYPLGASPQGVWDLGGNVWEWQSNYYDKDRDYLAIRGGSWYDRRDYARVSFRDLNRPYYPWRYYGFRVVAPASK